MRAPSLRWAVAALAATAILGSAAGTGAAWTDQTKVPGGAISTVKADAPTVSCTGLNVSWRPAPNASGYVVLVAGSPVATLPASSLGLRLNVGGLVRVEALYGPWTSQPSDPLTCL